MATHPHLRLVPPSGFAAFAGGAGADTDVRSRAESLVIDCAICVARETDVCDDCAVSYLVGHETGTPVVLDGEERRAVAVLAEAGLVPSVRFRSEHRPGVA
ncbi:MAG: hypothetical protein R2695_15790 [Acidimicrobiales bacterium]